MNTPGEQHYAGGPPRVVPAPPKLRLQIPGPPQRPPALGANISGGLALTALVMAGVFFIQGLLRLSSGASSGLMILAPIAYLATAIFGMLLRQRFRGQAMRDYENRYTEALNRAEEEIDALEEVQRAYYRELFPSPQRLLEIAGAAQTDPHGRPWAWRVFSRLPQHPDFLDLAAGKGQRPTMIEFKVPEPDPYKPELAQAIALAESRKLVSDTVLSVALTHVTALGVAGPPQRYLTWTRAVIAQVVTLHHPRDVRVAAFFAAASVEEWSWLSRLPHSIPLSGADHFRLLAAYDGAPAHLSEVLADLMDELGARLASNGAARLPALIVVIEQLTSLLQHVPELGRLVTYGPQVAMYILGLDTDPRHIPASFGGYIHLTDKAELVIGGAQGQRCRIDPLAKDRQYSMALARALARHSTAPGQRGGLARSIRWLDIHGVEGLSQLHISRLWQRQRLVGLEPIAIGVGANGEVILLDLNETHTGIFAMTGGGKSQLLTTIAVALMLAHSPDKLVLLCIDFKGRATFRALHKMPHVIGEVSDLDQEEARRALVAVEGELVRRKTLLDRLDVPDIATYERLGYPSMSDYGPLPYVVIFIEEFAALLDELPEFSDRFIKLANQGRSLGVLMILSSQHASSVPRSLRSNIGNWIALRVNDPEVSRSIIGVPDAATISKRTPGRAYLASDGSVRLFQTGIVTLPEPQSGQEELIAIDPYGRRPHAVGSARPSGNPRTDLERIEQTLVAARPSGYAASHYPIWRPSLASIIASEELPTLPPPVPGAIEAPLGLLDLPHKALQPVWAHSFSTDGHVLFLGNAQSGNDGALLTLARALIARYPPRDLHLYHLDRAGAESTFWEGAALPPHLGASVAFSDSLRTQQLCYRLRALLEQRRSRVARSRRSGLNDEAAVVLLCDGLEELLATVPEAEALLNELLNDGGSYNMFVAASARAWADLPRLRDRFQTVAVLRLTIEQESERLLGDRRAVRASLPPGRGYLRRGPEPIEFQVALASAAVAQELSAAEPDTRPAPLPEAPPLLRRDALAGSVLDPAELPIAVHLVQGGVIKLAPAGSLPHLLIAHEAEVAVDALLTSIIEGLLAHRSPEQVRLALVDYRRTYLASYNQRPHTRCFSLELNVPGKRELERRELSLVTTEDEFRALVDHLLSEDQVLGQRLLLVIRGWELMRGREAEAVKKLLPYAAERGIRLIVSGSDFGELTRLDLVQNRRLSSVLWLGMPAEAGRVMEQLGLKPGRRLTSQGAPPAWGYLRQGDRETAPVCFALAEHLETQEHNRDDH